MDFVPDTTKKDKIKTYFEDATSKDGWQGQATTLSVDVLKTKVKNAIDRLGGIVTNFQKGTFMIDDEKRDGFQILYHIEADNGVIIPGRIDIAALPIRISFRTKPTEGKRREQSLKMALYMLEIALCGTRFLEELSPGYATLMPFTLADENKTIAQLWTEKRIGYLLTAGEGEFVEGEFTQMKEIDHDQ
jgi:hypothetical protein